MRIVLIFEDMAFNQPSMIFDRYSQCPECRLFTFLGEWITPKDVQTAKVKKCTNCDKIIDALYLAKPSSGKSLAMDIKALRKRLESIVKMRADSGALSRSPDSSRLDETTSVKSGSPTESPRKTTASPTKSSPNSILNLYFKKIELSNK